MSSIRLKIKDSIMHYMCDDWNNHKRGKAHKENIALYDRKDNEPIWCNIDLEMIMEKVVKGIYATDFKEYEKQIESETIRKFYSRMNEELTRMLNSEFAFQRDKNTLLGVGRMLDMVAEELMK